MLPTHSPGSLYDIMRYAFPTGLKDEDLIAAILKQVLQGLAYFHQCQNIHRCALRFLWGDSVLLANILDIGGFLRHVVNH